MLGEGSEFDQGSEVLGGLHETVKFFHWASGTCGGVV